jgi:hypothetical protein
MQLGHTVGRHCPTKEAANKDFVVIHTNGIHLIGLDFCHCYGVPHRTQLLRVAWWPATPLEPKSCTTMECLRQFQLLNFQGKVTGFSYYRSLKYLTNNSGLSKPPVCHFHFLLILTHHSLLPRITCHLLWSWFVNIVTSKWQSEQVGDLIPQVYLQRYLVLLPLFAVHVPYLISTCPRDGTMYPQLKREFTYQFCVQYQLTYFILVGYTCLLLRWMPTFA